MANIDPKVLQGLKEKHPGVHLLMFHRSVQKATSGGHLFDILRTIVEGRWPMKWDDKERAWLHTDDILQAEEFFKEKSE